jgi:adenylosuccinate lyase
MREGRDTNDLVQRLAADKRLGLSVTELSSALEHPLEFVGAAPEQVRAFASRVETLVARYPEAARYQPEPML